MHDNVIIGLAVLTAFTLSIMLALYGMRLLDRDRQWRPRRYGVSTREVPCSFCGKLVRQEAIMCRHCHHRLDEIVADGTETEIVDAGVDGSFGIPQPADRRLAPAGTASYEIGGDDLLKNQTFTWLDNAFAQLTVKAAPAVWGPAGADRIACEEFGDGEASTRAIAPLGQARVLDAAAAKALPPAWTPKKEWAAVAAGLATLALLVGGSTFFVGPSKSTVATAAGDYVTFDVSERAPLYTGPDIKARVSTQPQPSPVAVKLLAVTPPEPTTIAKADAVLTPKPELVVEAPKPTVPEISAPVLPPVPAEDKAAAEMAAITPPPPSSAKSEPIVAPRREEDWASTVARAIKPGVSKDVVVAVQRLIRAEGYDPGTIDGTVGPRTRQAIRQYQRNGGLPTTGEIDRDLLRKLDLADRTVRVVGPMSGVASAAPVRSTAKPSVEWTK